ncbi:MAG: acetyl-CoA C-acetyltransferase [Desulforhopalus sp.]|jgi:acetyl-CoA C-acetyltransferase
MNKAVIVSGSRTAVGAFGGALKNVSAVHLGATVLRESLQKVGLRPAADSAMSAFRPERLQDQGLIPLEREHDCWDMTTVPVNIDEVIMGNVLQAGQGQNPARQAMISAGIPKETPAVTINKICGSGLKSIAMGAQSIMAGHAEVVLAGGQESMSMAPMALPKARWGHRMELSGTGEVTDLMVFDALYEIFYGYHMGVTAENIAKLYAISREDQDKLSVMSHARACRGIADGLFASEIVPIKIKSRREEILFNTDERPMATTLEKMARLKPVFDREGSVTAGNASGINDGAAAVVMMSEAKAHELGLTPIVTIEGFAAGGLDPAYMGLGPVPAIRKVLKQTKMNIADLDMIELNEAFASQAIGCMLELGIDIEKPNELGSGISMGHPVGCTGARQMVTGMYQMQRKGYGSGLVSMCIGGGMGMAMIVSS